MSKNIHFSIRRESVIPDHMWVGEDGRKTYLDVRLIPIPDPRYGDHYMVTQSIPKEARDSGEKSPILGNARIEGHRDALNPDDPILTGAICVTDLRKASFIKGKKGTYAAFIAIPVKEVAVHNFEIYQALGKEANARGELGPKVGVLTYRQTQGSGGRSPKTPAQDSSEAQETAAPDSADSVEDDIPF